MSDSTLFRILINMHIELMYISCSPENCIYEALLSVFENISLEERSGIVDIFMQIYKDCLPIIELTFCDVDLIYFNPEMVVQHTYDVSIKNISDKSVLAILSVY